MFIQDAMAQAAPAAQQGSGASTLIFMIIMFVIFYFILIRPQQKKVKEHQNMVGSLKKGDEVVTNGGTLGKLTAVGDSFVTVEISKGVEIRVQRHAIAAMMPKGTIKDSGKSSSSNDGNSDSGSE